MNYYYYDAEDKHSAKVSKKGFILTIIIAALVSVLVSYFTFSALRENMLQDVSGKITEELTAEIESSIRAELTEEVLEQYKREYKVPDEEVTIGTYAASVAEKSVVEIYCETQSSTSTATGMILNTEGYVLTNAHVVTYEKQVGPVTVRVYEHNKVYIKLYGESSYREAEIVDYDTDKDLAVIKLKSISGLSLQPITFGDSDALSKGEGAVVIGNAYGLGISVTTGTISNNNPTISGEDRDIIQTDTAINAGNSGGPILDYLGHCIGVATFKIADTTNASEGLGFGIASNYAQDYLTDLGIAFTKE